MKCIYALENNLLSFFTLGDLFCCQPYWHRVFYFHFMTICTIVNIKISKKIYPLRSLYVFNSFKFMTMRAKTVFWYPDNVSERNGHSYQQTVSDGRTNLWIIYTTAFPGHIQPHTKPKHIHNCKHFLFNHTQRVIVLRMSQWSLFSYTMHSNREDKYSIHTK
jgi:hypothetical protein